MSTPAQVPAQNQPDWFDANGQQIPPQQTGNQPQSAGDWFSDNSPDSGQVKNDVGETVIVPKDGESYQDTIRRAIAHGATLQQSDIDKEMATAPKKAAIVIGSLPVIAAAGVGGLTAADMGLWQMAKGLGYTGEAVKDALSTPAGRFILKRALDAGLGAGAFQYAMHTMKKAGMFSK